MRVQGVVAIFVAMDYRLKVIRQLHGQGRSLVEIGERLGLSGERVRQLLPETGVRSRSAAETARLRRQRQMQRADEVIAAYKGCGDVQKVARDLGVQVNVVKEAVATLPRPSVYRRRAPYQVRFSDDELLRMLRQAARSEDAPLAVSAFDAYAQGKTRRGKPWPTHATYLKRFGTWRASLQAAGLPARPPSPVAGDVKYSGQDCIRAIKKVARDVGSVPTAAQYEAAASTSNQLPSLGTIRNRFVTWKGALEKAELL